MPSNKNVGTFKKPPLSTAEKKAREESFLNLSEEPEAQEKPAAKPKREKEEIKSIFIRAPQSYWEDLQEISNTTGISMNAVCLELLRPAIKKKLRQLAEEY